MAGNTAKLVVQIVSDASQAGAGIKQASDELGGFRTNMGKLAAPAAGVLAAVTAFGVGALNSASDVQQAMGGLDAVFADNAAEVKAWSDQAAKSVGLSKAEYANFATVVGAQLKNLGVPMEDVAGNTDGLIKLGADLAATYGGTTAEAVSALSSALRGEADPAERYGLALNQTAVNAELASKGLGGLEGEAATAAKAQAILALATEQAGGALGQYGRESDTVAGQQATLNASWTDAQAALGEALLPVIAPLIGMLGDLAGWIQENAAVVGPLIAAVAALAAGILILNVVMAANPIGLIIVAVAALVVGIITLWNTNEDFRNFFVGLWKGIASFFTGLWSNLKAVVGAVFDGIQAAVNAVASFFRSVWASAVAATTAVFRTLGDIAAGILNAILAPVRWLTDAFNNVVSAIKSVIDWIGRIKIPDLGSLGNLFGGGKSAAPAAFSFGALTTSTHHVGRVGATRAGGSTTTTNITVMGGLDSADAIARRIDQTLNARARRAGGVRIGRATT